MGLITKDWEAYPKTDDERTNRRNKYRHYRIILSIAPITNKEECLAWCKENNCPHELLAIKVYHGILNN